MQKLIYNDRLGNLIEIYEDEEKVHLVVKDKNGVAVTEVVLNNSNEAHTWVKRKDNHNFWDERGL